MGLNSQIKDELLALSTGKIYHSKDEPKCSEADRTWFASLNLYLEPVQPVKKLQTFKPRQLLKFEFKEFYNKRCLGSNF